LTRTGERHEPRHGEPVDAAARIAAAAQRKVAAAADGAASDITLLLAEHGCRQSAHRIRGVHFEALCSTSTERSPTRPTAAPTCARL
jgi:hypothetical protein